MKVFISWSGEKSKKLAQVLSSWLPNVIQAVKPYFTPDGIEKGTRWNSEIAKELESSSVGIICLTKTNLQAPWIMFEAGALAKSMDKSLVVPILFEIESSELQGPLLQFQSTSFNENDFLRLFKTLNTALKDKALNQQILESGFSKWWSEFEKKIQDVLNETDTSEQKTTPRSDRELLKEILELSRHSAYNLSWHQDALKSWTLDMPIEALMLSKEITSFLTSVGIDRVGSLIKRTEAEMLCMKGFNRKRLNHIKEALAERGLSLGVDISCYKRFID